MSEQLDKFATTIIPTSQLGDPVAQGWSAPMSETKALGLPAYFSGVRFLSETLATLPAKVYKRNGSRRESADDHVVAKLLGDEPNELVTPATLWETAWHHAITWGNAYIAIERDDRDRPTALHNLPPDRVEPLRVDGRTWYAVARDDGGATPVRDRDIVHIAGLGFDGLKGYSPIQLMADSLGLGRSAQKWATKFYESGAHLGGVISTEAQLTPEQLQDVRTEINKRHSGLDNAAKWMVLMGGASATPLGAPPETAKLVEVLGVSVNQVAQILRVPPHALYDMSRATWANIEHQGRELVQYSLRPWLVKAEQAIRAKLFSRAERESGYFVRFNVDALLRGDHAAQMDAARLRLSEGITSVNEERAMLDMVPIDDAWANAYRVPANAMPASRLSMPLDTSDVAA